MTAQPPPPPARNPDDLPWNEAAPARDVRVTRLRARVADEAWSSTSDWIPQGGMWRCLADGQIRPRRVLEVHEVQVDDEEWLPATGVILRMLGLGHVEATVSPEPFRMAGRVTIDRADVMDQVRAGMVEADRVLEPELPPAGRTPTLEVDLAQAAASAAGVLAGEDIHAVRLAVRRVLEAHGVDPLHRRSDDRVCDTCGGTGEVLTMVPGATGEPVEGMVGCPDCPDAVDVEVAALQRQWEVVKTALGDITDPRALNQEPYVTDSTAVVGGVVWQQAMLLRILAAYAPDDFRRGFQAAKAWGWSPSSALSRELDRIIKDSSSAVEDAVRDRETAELLRGMMLYADRSTVEAYDAAVEGGWLPSDEMEARWGALVDAREAHAEPRQAADELRGRLRQMTDWRDECERQYQAQVERVGELTSELAGALERIDAAKRALVATGYYSPDQVGDDIAPRITELWSHAQHPPARDDGGLLVVDEGGVLRDACGMLAPAIDLGGPPSRCGRPLGHRDPDGRRRHQVTPGDPETTFTWEALQWVADGNLVRAAAPFGSAPGQVAAMCTTPDIAASVVELWNRWA